MLVHCSRRRWAEQLLTRLYDPSKGQVLIDGVDLREVDANDLRKRIGVIFQDFVRYYFPARENVGFGQIDRLEDEPRIIDSATRAGADTTIRSLPQGYDTMLGKWFEHGHDLSDGEQIELSCLSRVERARELDEVRTCRRQAHHIQGGLVLLVPSPC